MTHIFHKKRDPANHFDNTTVTIRVDADYLPDILEAFKRYLQACGFIIDGDLDVVPDDTKTVKDGGDDE